MPPLCFSGHIGICLVVLLLIPGCGRPPALVVATTTSLQDSGLLDELAPAFQARSGYQVKVIAVGSGQALELASRGEVDAALTHSPPRERELLAAGLLAVRQEVMANEFWLVGPPADPAGAGGRPLAEALAAVAAANAPFYSRGDDSGTHLMELALWEEAGVDPGGPWYRVTGQGMAATLRVAADRGAYTLTDSATLLALGEGLDLVRLESPSRPRLNVYSVVLPDPGRHPRVNAAGAREFLAFMLSDEAGGIVTAHGLFRILAGEGD